MTTNAANTIDPKMLNYLICPKSRGPLIYDSEQNILISKKAKLAFPIRDGVPILLVGAAQPYPIKSR